MSQRKKHVVRMCDITEKQPNIQLGLYQPDNGEFFCYRISEYISVG